VAACGGDLPGDPRSDGLEFRGDLLAAADGAGVRAAPGGGDAGQCRVVVGRGRFTAAEDSAGRPAFPAQRTLQFPQDRGPVGELAGTFDEPLRRDRRPPGRGYFLLGEAQVRSAVADIAREPLPVCCHAPIMARQVTVGLVRYGPCFVNFRPSN
jgi:hypothetical protein